MYQWFRVGLKAPDFIGFERKRVKLCLIRTSPQRLEPLLLRTLIPALG